MVRRNNLSILLILASGISFGNTDLIECKRDKETTRQFCYIKANNFESSQAFDRYSGLPSKGGQSSNYQVDLKPLFEDAGISIIRPSGKLESISFESLRPDITFTANWNDAYECRRNSLWDHDIQAKVRGEFTNTKISRGARGYKIRVSSFVTDDYDPLQIVASNDRLLIKTEVNFIDLDYSSDVPLPQERIPSTCKLLVTQPKLEFDPFTISRDLSFLKELVVAKESILSKMSIIHANIIDSQVGALCGAHNVGKKLKEAEVLFPQDSLLDLSLTSKNFLESLMIQAKTLGVDSLVSVRNEDMVDYLENNGDLLDSLCMKPSQYTVDKSKFIKDGVVINKVGYNNALEFERELSNLSAYLDVSWGLARASEIGASNSIDIKWLSDAQNYVHF